MQNTSFKLIYIKERITNIKCLENIAEKYLKSKIYK